MNIDKQCKVFSDLAEERIDHKKRDRIADAAGYVGDPFDAGYHSGQYAEQHN